MFSLKNYLMLLLGSLLCVSCTLPDPYKASSPQPSPVETNANAPKTPEQIKKEEDLKKARDKANAEAKARREKVKKEREASGGSGESGNSATEDVIQPAKRDPVKKPSKYRTARPIVTKPGYVFNPWTNKAVDVRGIPSGTLIRDPNDGNPDHKFRVP